MAGDQLLLLEAQQVAHQGDALPLQAALQSLADTPDDADRFLGQEVAGLRLADHREAARLVQVGGDLGQELVVRQADGGGDAVLLLDALDQQGERARRRSAVELLGAAQVQEGLVDGDRFDQRRDRQHQLPDGAAHGLVLGHVRLDHHGVGAGLQRLEHRHGRAHAVDARHVAGRRDHAAPPAADDHRLVGQLRIVALLHRGVEGVAVDVGDGEAAQLFMGHQPVAPAFRAAGRLLRSLEERAAISAELGHGGQSSGKARGCLKGFHQGVAFLARRELDDALGR